MLYADDVCIVSRSPQGLERMMATLVDVLGEFGLTHGRKTGNYELADPTCPRNADNIHHNRVTIPVDDFIYLPQGRDYGNPKLSVEIDRRIRAG